MKETITCRKCGKRHSSHALAHCWGNIPHGACDKGAKCPCIQART